MSSQVAADTAEPITIKPVRILLVEDNPGDVRLTQETFKENRVLNTLYVVPDGVEALAYLRNEGKYSNAPRPNMILLDLNLPRLSGNEVLKEIKSDEHLMSIPIVILTGSEAEADIARSYASHANCYIIKPVDLKQFIDVARSINDFWLSIVTLPPE